MAGLSLKRLNKLLSQFNRLRIGLLGDLFLDRYFEIDPNLAEVSIETELEAHQVVRIRNSAGALGTVMNNLATLGVGQLVPTTVIGADGLGHDLLETLQTLPVDTSGILQADDRLTPTYLKPLSLTPGQPPVELSRLDVRSRTPLDPEMRRKLIATIETTFTSCDGWIVMDQVNEQDCGVVHHEVREALQRLTQRHPEKLVFIDSRKYLSRFEFGTLKGNREEILEAAGLADAGTSTRAEQVRQAAGLLARRTGSAVYCTLGDDGILCTLPHQGEASRELDVRHVPGVPVEPPLDIVGAGDSATSGIVSALLCGASPDEAAALGNLVASITVRQLGTTGTANPQQLRRAASELNAPNDS